MSRSEHYFSLDETENALDYLKRAERFLGETNVDKLAWKWATIALHGALYGFAVAACRPEDVISETSKHTCALAGMFGRHQKLAAYFEGGKLIDIEAAVKLCLKKPSHGLLPGGKPYRLTDIQWKSVKQLSKAYRNNFEHFQPQRLIIPGDELPLIAANVLDVIRLIAVEISLIDHEIKDEVEAVVGRCKRILGGL